MKKKKAPVSDKSIHVIPLGNGWVVRSASSGKFVTITEVKQQAVSAGKLLAKNNRTTLVIHGKDGRIIESNSYFRSHTSHVTRAKEPRIRYTRTTRKTLSRKKKSVAKI